MINLKELRVGNIVLYTEDNDELPVLKIDGDSKTVCLDLLLGLNMELNEQDIDPIPLTPEWLERCGLPNDLSTLDVGGNYSLVFERREDNLFLVSSSAMESEVIRQIEYLHLFQNIYLDLTGEELAIKET